MKSTLMVLLEYRGFPPDIRVEKECAALTAYGWSITIVTYNTGNQLPTESWIPGVEIVRIPPKRRSFLGRTLFPFFPYPGYEVRQLKRVIESVSPRIIHVHDLPYAGTAIRAVANLPTKIVLDFHENMPAAMETYSIDRSKLFRIMFVIFRMYGLWRRHERAWSKRADRILIVTDEAAPRFRGTAQEEKLVLVGNTEDETTYPVYDEISRSTGASRPLRLLYFGGMGRHRGIETVLEGLRALGREASQVRLHIIGTSEPHRIALLKLCQDLGISEIVAITNWMPKDEIVKHLSECDFTLVPHRDLEHTNTTVPHKLFQSMISGKPVIVSSCPPLDRVVSESAAGFVFKADSPQSFAETLRKALSQDPREYRVMADNAARSASTTWSWKNDAKRLVQVYEDLADHV